LRKLLTLLAASAVLSTEAAALEKIQVTVPSLASNVGQLVSAADMGYFKEEGFDVEFVVAAGNIAVSALISGSVPFSASPSSAISAMLKGADLKIVQVSHNRAPYTLNSLVPDIKTLADLKGKQISITARGGTQEIGVLMLLDKHNLPRNHVSVAPMGFGNDRIAGLISGGVQPAAILSRADAGQLRDAGRLQQGHLLADVNKELVLPTGGVVVAVKSLEGAERARTRKFLRAAWKGTKFMQAHPDKATDFLHKRTPKISREAIHESVEAAVEELAPEGEVSLEDAGKELAVRGEMLSIPPDKLLPVAKLYDFTLIREVVRELRDWKPTL
jgi:NitT/TauT family transport system substrate-binding protein